MALLNIITSCCVTNVRSHCFITCKEFYDNKVDCQCEDINCSVVRVVNESTGTQKRKNRLEQPKFIANCLCIYYRLTRANYLIKLNLCCFRGISLSCDAGCQLPQRVLLKCVVNSSMFCFSQQ